MSFALAHATPRRSFALSKRILSSKLQTLLTTLDEATIGRIRVAFAALGFLVSLPDFVDILRTILPWQAPAAAPPEPSTALERIDEADDADAPSASSTSPTAASNSTASMAPGMTESEFVQAAVEFFQSVDVNGGQAIKFDDFLSAIIYAGVGDTGGDDGSSNSGGAAASSNPVRAYQRASVSLPVISSAPRDRLVRYLPGCDRVCVVEKNAFRLLEPATFAEPRRAAPVVCANDIVATPEFCRIGRGTSGEVLAVPTQRHLLLYDSATTHKIELRAQIATPVRRFCH